MIDDTEDDIGLSAPVSSAQSEDEAAPASSGLPSGDEEEAAMDESDTSTVNEDEPAPIDMPEEDPTAATVVQTEVSIVQAVVDPVEGEVQVDTTTMAATEVRQVPDDDATSPSPINDEEGAEDTTLTLDSAADAGVSDLFFVDTGADTTMSYEQPLCDTTASSAPIGSAAPPADDVEDIVFRPQLIADPVSSLPPAASTSRRPETSTDFELSSVYIDPRIGMSRKEKKAAKRAKRASRKSRKRQEARMRADSDVDWGSDMEAAGVVGVEVDELGERIASAGLDDEDQELEEDVDPDLDYEAMARFSRGIGFGQGTGGELAVDVETDSDDYEELPAKGKAAVRVSKLGSLIAVG